MGTQCVQGPQQNNYDAAIQEPCPQQIRVWVLLPSLESNKDRGHHIKAIESLQRTFTSKISGLQHLSYWERLERLNMMSLQRRRERYLIIHMWKVRMAQVPNDLNIKFHYNDRLGLKAIVPKAPQSHVGSVYQNLFAVKGPRLWNMLPKDLTLGKRDNRMLPGGRLQSTMA